MVGKEKWESIDKYINKVHPELRLDQIIYNSNNWIEFEKWFYKNLKGSTVNVCDVWQTDYGDYKALAEIGKNKELEGTIITSYDEQVIRNITDIEKGSLTVNELKNAFAVLIWSDIEKYLKLPTISNVSKLLKEIYDCVVTSECSMCHIDYNEWEDFYDDYNERDIEQLKKEIEKYNLKEVIEIDNGEYKIVGYGDLETRFLDDRNYCKELDSNITDKIMTYIKDTFNFEYSNSFVRNTFSNIIEYGLKKHGNSKHDFIKYLSETFDELEYEEIEKIIDNKEKSYEV
jgi:hypothetical protein